MATPHGAEGVLTHWEDGLSAEDRAGSEDAARRPPALLAPPRRRGLLWPQACSFLRLCLLDAFLSSWMGFRVTL